MFAGATLGALLVAFMCGEMKHLSGGAAIAARMNGSARKSACERVGRKGQVEHQGAGSRGAIVDAVQVGVSGDLVLVPKSGRDRQA